MAGISNSLIQLGYINLTQASVNVPSFTNLNVTAPYLARPGIRLALEGELTRRIGTMTGVVPSPQVYQDVRVTIALVKTLTLAQQWQLQYQVNSVIGTITVTPDLMAGAGIAGYMLLNTSIQGVRELDFSGDDVGYVIELQGVYPTNNAIWQG
jgi:hypothetical protein